jgi:adenylosuccinate lyase
MATENLLMAAVAAGADRQEAHEQIRKHSRTVSAALRTGSGPNNLLELLRQDKLFARVRFDDALVPEHFVGRAPQQVEEFLAEEVAPVRQRYPHLLDKSAEVQR